MFPGEGHLPERGEQFQAGGRLAHHHPGAMFQRSQILSGQFIRHQGQYREFRQSAGQRQEGLQIILARIGQGEEDHCQPGMQRNFEGPAAIGQAAGHLQVRFELDCGAQSLAQQGVFFDDQDW
jgi:hypothetical protein